MSTTPPDEPTGTPGQTPPPSGPDYGAPTPPPPPGYGTPPGSGPDYGTPPGGGYGTPPGGGYGAPPPPPGGGYGGPGGYGDYGPGGYGGPEEPWSIGNALTYGWTKFRANLGPIILLTLALFAGLLVAGVITNFIQLAAPDTAGYWGRQLFSAIATFLGFVIQTVAGAIVVRGGLDVAEGRDLDFGSIWSRIPFGPLIVLAILQSVIVAIGIVLFFLPGLIAIFLLYFSTYFLLDRNPSPVDSLKASVTLVANNLGSAFVWVIVAAIVTVVGVCLCCVGLLATIPIATIGTAYTYKRLTGQPVAP